MFKVCVLLILAVIASSMANEKKVICYYGSWATYRHGNGKCEVNNLDPYICTHLVYGFVGINEDATVRIMDPWLELPDNWGKDNFGQFNSLKAKNPNLKTIVAIGGWNEGTATFSRVANDPLLRGKFAKNAAEFTSKYGFDGMDMDWEYPAQRESPNESTDKQAYSLLLAEMRQEFDKKQLSLSAAVAAVKASASLSYDIPTISKYLDFINVMAYDLHGAWDTTTGYNAALKRYDGENLSAENSLNVENAINYWLSEGAPKEKIVLGIPLYGRTFRLQNSAENKVGSPSNGAGIAGQYTSENGMIGYNELCEKRLTESWPKIWDDQAQVPYTYNGNNWITYDDEESIELKVKFALSKDLGGIMVWSIETDDFRAVCGQKYPLLRKINEVIGKSIPETTTTTTTTSTTGGDGGSNTTTTTTTTSTTEGESGSSTTTTSTTGGDGGSSTTTTSTTTVEPSTSAPDTICVKSGYVRDPRDCDIFYVCVLNNDGDSYTSYKFACPGNLVFDTTINTCNYKYLVDCN